MTNEQLNRLLVNHELEIEKVRMYLSSKIEKRCSVGKFVESSKYYKELLLNPDSAAFHIIDHFEMLFKTIEDLQKRLIEDNTRTVLFEKTESK